jgi:hypothetical protein
MTRTIGRRRKLGETGSSLCDRCGTRWPRSSLWRDLEGLLNCPQEGKGRDAVSLTKANVASAKAYARSYDRPPRYPGCLDKETATPIASLTGMLLTEDNSPLLTEDGGLLLLES